MPVYIEAEHASINSDANLSYFLLRNRGTIRRKYGQIFSYFWQNIYTTCSRSVQSGIGKCSFSWQNRVICVYTNISLYLFVYTYICIYICVCVYIYICIYETQRGILVYGVVYWIAFFLPEIRTHWNHTYLVWRMLVQV